MFDPQRNHNLKYYKLLVKINDSKEYKEEEFIFNLNPVMKNAPKR